MSYKIYTTPSLILETYPTREVNKTVLAYTRDMGLIYVDAIGARKLSSKLRYSLEPYTLGTLSLVRAKAGWRLTSASGEGNFYQRLRGDAHKCATLFNTVRLLRRLVVGENPEPELFDITIELFEALNHETTEHRHVPGLELLLVLQILSKLGYVGDELLASKYLSAEAAPFPDLFLRVLEEKDELIKVVNDSLKESQL